MTSDGEKLEEIEMEVEIAYVELIWIISALVIAATLTTFNLQIVESSERSDAYSICSSIATILDRIGSCPGECYYLYKMPKFGYGGYKLKFSKDEKGGIVALIYNGKQIAAAVFSSELEENFNNIECKNVIKIIKKKNGKIRVEEVE